MNILRHAQSRWGASSCLQILVVSACLLLASIVSAQDLAPAYQAEIQPLLKTYCYECHSGDTLEADLDFAAFPDLNSVRKQSKVWLKVAEMLASDQMPPPTRNSCPPQTRRDSRSGSTRCCCRKQLLMRAIRARWCCGGSAMRSTRIRSAT